MGGPNTFQEPSSGDPQFQDGINGEAANAVVPSQESQALISDVRDDIFAHQSDMSFTHDGSSSVRTDLRQPQLTPHPIIPPLDPGQAIHSQDEAHGGSLVWDAEGFHGWTNPMGWFLQDDYDLENFSQFLFGINSAHVDASQADRVNASGRLKTGLNTSHTQIDHSKRRISDLRPYWHTQVSVVDGPHGAVSRCVTPTTDNDQSKDDIDEIYRANAASNLLFKNRNEPLPSIGLLNLFIHLFFTRFNLALPLIHGPTFKPRKENGLLVLSICSAGSLWFGSKEARNAGSMLFERVNKAILESPWERCLLQRPSDSLNTLKASLIGQTFGLLSGDPIHLETAAGYHGSVLSIARRLKIFDETSEVPLEGNPSKIQLHEMWRNWARSEERKRLAACLYIHDAEIAAIFHHEPFLRHNSRCLPRLSSTDLFNASSPEAWYSKLRAERGLNAKSSTETEQGASTPGRNVSRKSEMQLNGGKTSPSVLEIYSTLSGIGASISASRRLNTLTTKHQAQYESELLAWYDATAETSHGWASSDQGTSQVTVSILALWHSTWISLYVDLNILELAIGREGPDISRLTIDYVNSWASSKESLRCLLHAWLLQDYIVRMPSGPFFAIHIPRVLFSAAVIWHCFITYSPDDLSSTSGNRQTANGLVGFVRPLPEVQTMTRERSESLSWVGAFPAAAGICHINESILRLQETLGSVSTQIKQQTLYTLADVLRRSSSYGIASRMADIIEILLSHDMDDAQR